jgi:very-short-patch-repair endonuclease
MTSDQARRLRRNLTDAEARLWSVLRRRQMEGRHFRRQAPIGPYIADFVCFAEALIIEVDGGQHAETTARDQARTRWLEAQGFRVIRFWNHDVLANIEGVAETIRRVLRHEESSVF